MNDFSSLPSELDINSGSIYIFILCKCIDERYNDILSDSPFLAKTSILRNYYPLFIFLNKY